MECDPKSFFDTINHDRLMNALMEKVQCRQTLGLIRREADMESPEGSRARGERSESNHQPTAGTRSRPSLTI